MVVVESSKVASWWTGNESPILYNSWRIHETGIFTYVYDINYIVASWWFQAPWKIFVNLDDFPR